MCNNAVYIFAKEAAEQLFPIPAAELDAYFSAFRKAKSVLRASARMLALWPSNFNLYGRLPLVRSASVPGKVKLLTKHKFVWADSSWICTSCLRRKYSSVAHIDSVPCALLVPSLLSVIKEPNGHSLSVTSCLEGVPLVFCVKCGYYASTRCQNLKRPCCGRGPKLATALVRLMGFPSRHPHTLDVMAPSYSVDRVDIHWHSPVAPSPEECRVQTDEGVPSGELDPALGTESFLMDPEHPEWDDLGVCLQAGSLV